MNVRKTKIYSFGKWQGKLHWPIKDIKVEIEHFKTLGITFSTDYNRALDLTWNDIHRKIEKRIQMIRNRNFTMYQKAALINSLISSKIWYVAHTYPLPVTFVKQINKVIFQFIWNSKVDHIKRDTLCSSKLDGGIGLINIDLKAKAIFTATTLKTLLFSEDESLIRYYIMEKMNKITKLGNNTKEKAIHVHHIMNRQLKM